MGVHEIQNKFARWTSMTAAWEMNVKLDERIPFGLSWLSYNFYKPTLNRGYI